MKKLFLYILLTICLAFTVREVLYIGIKKNKTGEYDKLNTIFEKHNTYNTIIAGSSRAESHFNPRIIDSITGLNSFNTGITGGTLPMILASIEAYLHNSKSPDYVILNLDFQTFAGHQDTIYNYPRYFPYLDNKILFNCLNDLDPRFTFFKWIPFYSMPFFGNNYLNASLRGYFNLERSFDKNFINGYIPPLISWTTERLNANKYRPFELVPEKNFIPLLDSLIRTCKQKNIQLILVSSPSYIRHNESILNFEKLGLTMRNIAFKNDIVFFDFSSDELSKNKDFFADPMHLNEKGSKLFSEKFGICLWQYLHK